MISQSKLIIKHLDGFGGNKVDSLHLAEAFETGGPTVLEGMLMRIFSSKSYFMNSQMVLSLTGAKSNGTMEVDSDHIRWSLQGSEDKFARVVENVESTNANAGLLHSEFNLKLDLDYFAAPDVLFGEDNEYPLQIIDGPVPDGVGNIYRVRIQGDNPNVFFPQHLMEPGKEFSKVWTSTPNEANDEFGTQAFPNSFMLETQMGAFAQKFSVTDKAWRHQGKIAVKVMYKDKDGRDKMADSFLPMAEGLMYKQLYESMEANLVYAKKQTFPAKNGYFTKIGFLMGHAA